MEELQKHKAERLARSVGPSEIASSAPPSVTDDDGKSLTSFQSEGYVHTSQIAAGDGDSGSVSAEGGAEGAEKEVRKLKKTKAQLWNEMKISCVYSSKLQGLDDEANLCSDNAGFYPIIHSLPSHTPHTDTAESPWPPELPRQRCFPRRSCTRVQNQPRE